MALQDSESVVEALVERGQATAALAVLRRPGVSQELSTKFAPALLAIAPAQTVDAWMSSQPPMDPRYVRSFCSYLRNNSSIGSSCHLTVGHTYPAGAFCRLCCDLGRRARRQYGRGRHCDTSNSASITCSRKMLQCISWQSLCTPCRCVLFLPHDSSCHLLGAPCSCCS